ncbi:MFS transporter [Actinomycetes bacterium KLBMP 9797]
MTPRQRVWLMVVGLVVVVLAAGTVVVALLEAGSAGERVVAAARGDRQEATFELVSGVPAARIRAADLGGDLYRIATPATAAARPEVTDDDGVVRLALAGDPAESVDVALSAAVRWRVRVAAGSDAQTVDLAAGRVSGVDLAGGANRIDLALPPAAGTVPVRLSGGAGQVGIRLSGDTPARVTIGSGAATVIVNGEQRTGVAGGTVFEPAGWAGARDRYAIDVAAGVSTRPRTSPGPPSRPPKEGRHALITGCVDHVGVTRQLWRDRHFGIFWAAQTLSVAGDSFATIAIPLLVLRATGSVAQMGLLTGIAGVAAVTAGVFGGLLVDRLDRRRLLIVCDLIRMVLYASIPVAWSFGEPIWLLYAVLPACAAVGMIFQVGYVTAVRNLVDTERITEANGLLYATAATAAVAGPLLAGVVSGWLGATAAIAVNAASFAVSAAGVALIRLRPHDRPAPAGDRPLAEFFAGARFLWQNRVLRSLTILLSIFIFLTLGLTDVLIYYVKHVLGRSDATVGAVLGLAAIGTVTGALVVARLRRRVGFGRAWIGAHAVCGLAIAGIGLSREVAVIGVLTGAYLCCVSIAGTCSMSLRQQITPNHLLGRVTSAFWAIHFSLGPIGAAALTWAAGRFGVTAVFLAAGAGCTLVALVALATPIRQRHPERTVHGQGVSPVVRTT